MVVTIPATQVEAGAVYVDDKGKHMVEAVKAVRGQIALMIDGLWVYRTTHGMVNVLV